MKRRVTERTTLRSADLLYRVGACPPIARSVVWLVSLGAVVLGGWLFVIQPCQQEWSDLLGRRVIAQQSRGRLAEIRVETTELQADIQRQQRILADVQSEERPRSTLFKKLSKLTHQTGLEIVATDSANGGSSAGPSSGIRITVEGTFQAILMFLYEISTGPDMPVLSSYVLRPVSETQSPDMLQLDCVLSASRQHVS